MLEFYFYVRAPDFFLINSIVFINIMPAKQSMDS